jgi:hypothetical protein
MIDLLGHKFREIWTVKYLLMQKIVAAKLIPSKTQTQALKATLAVFADACNQAVKVAQENNLS